MIFAYILIGIAVYIAGGSMPQDPLWDIQTDRTRPPTRRELAAAILAWTIAILLWPVALAWRTARAISKYAASHRRQRNS